MYLFVEKKNKKLSQFLFIVHLWKISEMLLVTEYFLFLDTITEFENLNN